jgi:predicted dehydrogenase
MSELTKNETNQGDFKMNRRHFIKKTAAAFAFTVVPRHVLGGSGYTSPSEKLNIACIGAGGRGAHDLKEMSAETENFNVVGLCDLDENYMKSKIKQVCPEFINTPYYADYRKMFDSIGDKIDAVIISTPDHSHAVITMDCMERGKHVLTQKPLTHNIYEARLLKKTARELKIVSQMGIQAHAYKPLRMGVDLIQSGILGTIHEVHIWTNRPAWKQGIPRPKETPAVPEGFDWDQWIGPAPYRPYHPSYHPFHWRGYWDFGTGALGDMGCHIFDQPFWALDLRNPSSVEAFATDTGWWQTDLDLSQTAPVASILRYEFPKRGKRKPLTLYWYDGGLRPLRPENFEDNRTLPDQGIMYVGENGTVMCPYVAALRMIPESKMKGFKYPEQTIPDSPGHFKEWVDACTGTAKLPHANFDYSSELTETVLLGCVALRAGVGRKYLWDADNMQITNFPEANRFVKEQYRQGWTL